jgi:hypothetical protein
MAERIAGLTVLVAAAYLIGLGVIALAAPRLAARFLTGFASTATTHWVEMVLRVVAGAGFVAYAPQLRGATGFAVFGWMLISSSLVLLVLPWQWHQRFAQRTMPQVVRHLSLVGACALGGGAFVLFAVFSRS